ncbi:hypothetical protein NDU88_002800 [Pleurodeles waltl]|uniref:Uncharacterized protein n=1 Tax=Pleurodeles waltl TaxID=8319 RepID=A0AAV7NI35_PLEWA|nr:hypothetical protein NDU88_002800 [Pleurodeles waltl]
MRTFQHVITDHPCHIYHQKQGMAMGTCFAPSYANSLVGWWEKHVAWAEENDPWKENGALRVMRDEKGRDRISKLRQLESQYTIEMQTWTLKGLNVDEEMWTYIG